MNMLMKVLEVVCFGVVPFGVKLLKKFFDDRNKTVALPA